MKKYLKSIFVLVKSGLFNQKNLGIMRKDPNLLSQFYYDNMLIPYTTVFLIFYALSIVITATLMLPWISIIPATTISIALFYLGVTSLFTLLFIVKKKTLNIKEINQQYIDDLVSKKSPIVKPKLAKEIQANKGKIREKLNNIGIIDQGIVENISAKPNHELIIEAFSILHGTNLLNFENTMNIIAENQSPKDLANALLILYEKEDIDLEVLKLIEYPAVQNLIIKLEQQDQEELKDNLKSLIFILQRLKAVNKDLLSTNTFELITSNKILWYNFQYFYELPESTINIINIIELSKAHEVHDLERTINEIIRTEADKTQEFTRSQSTHNATVHNSASA